MLKWAGVLLIVAGAGGLGRYFSISLSVRLAQLVECREIFAQLDVGRDCLKLPYAQLLQRTARGKTPLFSGLLCKIADEMEQNRHADAGSLWEAALREERHRLFLKEEEILILVSLAKSLMLEGNHTQVFGIYLMQLKDGIKQAMEEKKEKQKLYGSVSILGGLFLIILLL